MSLTTAAYLDREQTIQALTLVQLGNLPSLPRLSQFRSRFQPWLPPRQTKVLRLDSCYVFCLILTQSSAFLDIFSHLEGRLIEIQQRWRLKRVSFVIAHYSNLTQNFC